MIMNELDGCFFAEFSACISSVVHYRIACPAFSA